MRPTPIPDAEVWEGATRKVFAAPDGDLLNPTIAPVEALVDQAPDGTTNISVCLELEQHDLATLQAGGRVWLTFWGHIVPFALTTVTVDGERVEADRG